MDKEQTIAQLRQVMSEQLELALPDVIKEEDRLYEDLNVDSIMVLQLVVYIEEVFNVTVPEEDLDPAVFQTVSSLVDFIHALKGEPIAQVETKS
ncbi:acyl carrier protein [Paenibacillus sp. FSL R7-277]|uniref:phosphopantetheine-binding protein n=1 Tax=Paenibacillus sp. FSL R7-277 TaxID=1227352 RepID=UPI0003E2239B|nr:phosphopantetheine-binding protein [Paenibacillus sp. FSL R7-277]ETT69649.1 acyl carrier protein [Paenibacillus sp. FSL R7-277]